jgi:hypothetical protein
MAFAMGGGLVLLCGAGAMAVSGVLSPANMGWLGAFAVLCAASLVALQRSSSPARSIAEVLYDTEHPGTRP